MPGGSPANRALGDSFPGTFSTDLLPDPVPREAAKLNGLVWKALRREWFLLRWIEWASIGTRRGLLYARWAVRDSGRWLVAGWGSRWIEWRIANLASAGAIVGAFVVEFLRPIGAVASAIFLGVSERDRKWLLPSIAGTIGLLLLILLFLQQGSQAVATPDTPPERFVELAPEPKSPPIRVVDVPELRDPFAELDVPERRVPPPRPEVVFEPEPEPVAPRFPVPADLTVSLDRGPIRADWEPRLDAMAEDHFSSAARSIAPIDPGELLAREDGWDRHTPRMFDPNLVAVAHTVREFALATASSTLVREDRPAPVVESPPVVIPRAPQPEPEPEPVRFDTEAPVEPANVRLNVNSPKASVRIDDPCIVDIEVANVGGSPADSLVVYLDLPPAVEHRLGEMITLDVGTLAPGAVRKARLVASAAEVGRATVAVRLLSAEVHAEETTAFEIGDRAKPASPPTRRPAIGNCCR